MEILVSQIVRNYCIFVTTQANTVDSTGQIDVRQLSDCGNECITGGIFKCVV